MSIEQIVQEKYGSVATKGLSSENKGVKAIAEAFVSKNGAIQVKDRDELEKVLAELLSDDVKAAQLGLNALRVVRENTGAIERTLDMVVNDLHESEVYIAPKRATHQP